MSASARAMAAAPDAVEQLADEMDTCYPDLPELIAAEPTAAPQTQQQTQTQTQRQTQTQQTQTQQTQTQQQR
ncbi:hypothetical protein TeGR_g5075 [Tetraparma gracilis]|uniref:Uncharacterized protein n=1 Tax=Tetraparma gracilis TaxID=2962635 RepID=A0ABQ6MJF7_9STRA|nr:hypothetical protein TeGR_g5075 [Tetraparma gracilis]